MCRGQCHPVLPDQGPHLSSGTPQLDEDMSVPHVAPLHAVMVTTPCPSALPAPAGTVPGAGDSWEGPGSSMGKPRTDPGPLQRGPGAVPPRGHPPAALGLPSFTPVPAAPQNCQLLSAGHLTGHPKCFRTRVLGGTQQHKWLHACWGDREQGGRPWCPTAQPWLAEAEGEDGTHTRHSPSCSRAWDRTGLPARRGVAVPAPACEDAVLEMRQ